MQIGRASPDGFGRPTSFLIRLMLLLFPDYGFTIFNCFNFFMSVLNEGYFVSEQLMTLTRLLYSPNFYPPTHLHRL